MFTTLLLTFIILLVCVVLLSVGILLKKNGSFPAMHIGDNQALKKQGIQCARSQHDEQVHRKNLEERLKEIIE
ncbi:MAG: hypothetical protein LBS88_01915 [Tannerellaceae bacterium]|jgi:hypothetical protein|nr:hypothetical protein [Tannerellaceae bacterium]